MEKENEIAALFVTANLGSLFETIDLVDGWVKEIELLISQNDPQFLLIAVQV